MGVTLKNSGSAPSALFEYVPNPSVTGDHSFKISFRNQFVRGEYTLPVKIYKCDDAFDCKHD